MSLQRGGGPPISRETALVALSRLDNGLIGCVVEAGDRLMVMLNCSADRSPLIGEAHAKDLMVGVKIVKEARASTSCASSLLVVTDQQIDLAGALFTKAVVDIERELPHAA